MAELVLLNLLAFFGSAGLSLFVWLTMRLPFIAAGIMIAALVFVNVMWINHY